MEAENQLSTYRDVYHLNKKPLQLPDFPLKATNHPDSWTGKKALEHLDQCSQENNFMWVSFSEPHYPMDAPKESEERIHMELDDKRIFEENEWDDTTKLHRNSYFGPGGTEGSGNAPNGAQKEYDEAYWVTWRKKYYANIVQIDDYIDQIIIKARKKWGNNLMILFTSDHGDMMGNHGLWGKNHILYEDVVRVPLIIQYPGQTKRIDQTTLVSSLDVIPTILHTAGYKHQLQIDGKVLNDVISQGGRPFVISKCQSRLTIIKDNLKLCVNEFERTKQLYLELYDLEHDPYEFKNIYHVASYEEQKKNSLLF